MTTAKRQREQQADQQTRECQRLNAVIGKHVIHRLGQLSDLHRVQVRMLWEGCYRVNIFVGVDAASARVAYSYFVVADADGNIIESTPKIAGPGLPI